MLKNLEIKLAAEWHKLVKGSEDDWKSVLEFIETHIERNCYMSIETVLTNQEAIIASITALDAKVSAITAPVIPPVDFTPVLTELTKIEALIGTPAS